MGRATHARSWNQLSIMRGLVLALVLPLLCPSTCGVDSTHKRACEQLTTCGSCVSGATLNVDGANESFACYYCPNPKNNSSNCQGWNSVLDLLDPHLPCPFLDVNFLDCTLYFGSIFSLVLAAAGAFLLLVPACLAVLCCRRLRMARLRRNKEDNIPLRGRGGAAATLRVNEDEDDIRNDEELSS